MSKSCPRKFIAPQGKNNSPVIHKSFPVQNIIRFLTALDCINSRSEKHPEHCTNAQVWEVNIRTANSLTLHALSLCVLVCVSVCWMQQPTSSSQWKQTVTQESAPWSKPYTSWNSDIYFYLLKLTVKALRKPKQVQTKTSTDAAHGRGEERRGERRNEEGGL